MDFRKWFQIYGLARDGLSAGRPTLLGNIHQKDPEAWYNAIEGIGLRCFRYGFRQGRTHERERAEKEIAALKAELRQAEIDEIVTATYSASDDLCDSAGTGWRAAGLRKLAKWGVVEIVQDNGKGRVIARRLDQAEEKA